MFTEVGNVDGILMLFVCSCGDLPSKHRAAMEPGPRFLFLLPANKDESVLPPVLNLC